MLRLCRGLCRLFRLEGVVSIVFGLGCEEKEGDEGGKGGRGIGDGGWGLGGRWVGWGKS